MVAFTENNEHHTQSVPRARGHSRTHRFLASSRSNSASRFDFRTTTSPMLVRLGSCSRDPIGFVGGIRNIFEFVSSNPLASTDPSGLQEAGTVVYGDEYTYDWSSPNGFSIEDANGKKFGLLHLYFYFQALGDCDGNDAKFKNPRIQTGVKFGTRKITNTTYLWTCTVNSVSVTAEIAKQIDVLLEEFCACQTDGSMHGFEGLWVVSWDITCTKFASSDTRRITGKAKWKLGAFAASPTLWVGPCWCPGSDVNAPPPYVRPSM